MKDGKRGHLRNLTTLESFPSEMAGKLPIVELLGNRRVILENHCGVAAYGDKEIAVRVRDGLIHILGKDLELVLMSKERLVITGRICAVSLEERRCAHGISG